MGKKKYVEEVTEFINKTPVFRGRDIEKIVGSKEYAHLILHFLTRKNKIIRLSKDCYSRYMDPIVSVYCYKPAYIGLQEALSIHRLWEQETITIIITVKKARVGIRNVLDSNILVRRVSPRYFFGVEMVRYSDSIYIPVSDIEKTIIDMIYFNERLDKSILKEIVRIIDYNKLKNYLEYYPQGTRNRVLRRLSEK